MPRHAYPHAVPLLFFMFIGLSVAGQASESRDATVYPLWYPPIAALHVDSPQTLKNISRTSQFRAWEMLSSGSLSALSGRSPAELWAALPLASAVLPKTWLRSLTRAKAKNLTAFLLPGDGFSRFHLLFTVQAPALTTQTKRARFLATLGAMIKTVTHISWRGDTLVMASVFTKKKDGRFTLRPDAKLPQRFYTAAPPRRMSAVLPPWRVSLQKTLRSSAGTLGVWLHPDRPLAWLAARQRFFLQANLRQANWRQVTAFSLEMQAENGGNKSLAFTVNLHRATKPMQKITSILPPPPRVSLRQVFPRDKKLLVFAEANLQSILPPQEPNATDHNMAPLWRLLLEAITVAAPDSRQTIESSLRALRTLTGIHPAPHLLANIAPSIAAAAWKDTIGVHHWGIVLPVKERENQTSATLLSQQLRRSLAWFNAISQKQKWSLNAQPLNLPDTLFACRIYHTADDQTRAVITLTPRHIIIASETKAATAMLKSSRATYASDTNTAAPALLRWEFNFAEQAQAAAPYVGIFNMIPLFLNTESGTLTASPGSITIQTRGAYAPVSLVGFAYTQSPRLMSITKSDDTGAARAWLRRFLEAAQTYRNLDLGRYNNRPGHYPASLLQLIDDKDAQQKPLAQMYARLYDPPPADRDSYTVTFEQLIRYLNVIANTRGDQRQWQGYQFFSPQQIAGKKINSEKRWALIAVPPFKMSPRVRPALVIYEDGLIYRYTKTLRTPEDIIRLRHLPANPATQSWQPIP